MTDATTLSQPSVAEGAARVLLQHIVDYAGLFPPAGLDLAAAVWNFADYRASEAGWMLGRFVLPATELSLFTHESEHILARADHQGTWRLSVTASTDVTWDMRAITAFNERHGPDRGRAHAIVDAYEVKAATPADIRAVSDSVSAELSTFIEIPVHDDPASLLEAIRACGRRAKIRTGGIVPEAFPSADDVARFLITCARLGVTAKATAGLHHPLRDTYRLTYEANPPRGLMFGYVNVFLAAVLVAVGAPVHDVTAMLEERDASTIVFDATGCRWTGGTEPYALARDVIAAVRERGLTSFGSCSFTEPVHETRALGWL